MGRVFNRLKKQVTERAAERERFVNYGARLSKIEEHLYELSSYVVNEVPQGDEITLTARQVEILAAHEEFRHFLEKVTRQNG